jgi:hypothetical protein
MSAWDRIMPHSLLINRSLRKASEGLRSHINEYQLEHDREIERCSAEIEQAKVDKDSNFEKITTSLIDELSKDSALLNSVQTGLLKYVDLYLRRQSLNKVREIKTIEKKTLVEYADFLSAQMKLIGDEIEILEARKDKLVIQAKVDDVLELIGLSDCEIAVTTGDDAKTLSQKVTESLMVCDDDDWLTRHSLRRLRTVLQDRVNLFPIIQYISWTMHQKILLSRQLSNERRSANKDKIDKGNEIRQVRADIGNLNFFA